MPSHLERILTFFARLCWVFWPSSNKGQSWLFSNDNTIRFLSINLHKEFFQCLSFLSCLIKAYILGSSDKPYLDSGAI